MILLGPPGSGKGTQGDLIEDQFGFPKISVGDLLRKAVEQEIPLGLKAKDDMNKGELVKDNIIIALIKKRICQKDCENGYTLDGFPRNISQAESLEEMASIQNEVAIDLRISDRTAVERLSSRYVCADCNNIYNIEKDSLSEKKRCDRCGGKLIQRKDDKPEVIKRRLAVYHKETERLINYYRKKNVYKPVNGESSKDEVFKRICFIINKFDN
ncbi:MAG: adenylate kinase [Acidobacteriota bacterium]